MTSGIGKLKIRTRLILSFAIIISLMLAGNTLLAWQFHLVNQHSDRVSALARELAVVSRFQTDLLSLDATLDSLAKSEDVEGLTREAGHSRSVLGTDVGAIRDALVHLPFEMRGNAAPVPIVVAVETTWSPQLDAVIALGAASDWNAVRLRLADERKPLEARVSGLVRNVQQQVSDEVVRSVAQSEQVKSRILLILPMTAFLTLLFATLLGTLVTRSITVPLRRLLDGSTALARGNFDYQVQLRGKDELAHVGAVFNETSTKLGELYRRLEEAQRIIHVGYWERDLVTDRITWSDETYRIFGLQPQEYPMDLPSLRQKIHPQDWEFVSRVFDEALGGGTRYNAEYRLVRPTGEVRIVHSNSNVKRDASGRPYQMFGTFQDITDRRRAEEALRQSQFYLSEGQRLAHMGSWALNPLGFFDHWSHEMFQIHGLNPEKVAPTLEQYLAIFHPQDRDLMAETIKEMHTRRSGCDVKRRIVRPDGEIRYVRCVGIPVMEEEILKGFLGTAMDVTDQELLTQELQRQQAYLAEAQRLSHTGSWTFDASGFQYWSSELFRIHGLDPGGNIPTIDEYLRLVHPDERQFMKEAIQTMLADRCASDFTKRIVRPDGETRHVRCVSIPVIQDGIFQKFIGTGIDVTEQMRLTDELRLNERYLSEGQRLAHMGSWAFNPSGFFEYWSHELFQIYGIDPKKGAPTVEQYLATVHPQDRDFMADTLRRMHAERIGCDVKKRIVRPDGELRYVRYVGIPVIEDEVLKGFLGTAMDVTDQELLTQELERQQAYLNEGQRLSHTASWAWGVENLSANRLFHVHVSDEWYRIYGFNPGDGPMFWERYSERIHPDDRVWWKGRIERAIQEKADYDEVVRLLLPGGVVKWIRIVGHPVLDAAGNLIQLVGSSSDITERKHAEQERERLRQLEADLAHVNRVSTLGEMAASLAHEIKQPLAAAIASANTCVEWLAHEPPNLGRARAAAARIDKYGNRATEIIDRIRSFYRKSPPKRELVDVNQIIDEILALLKGQATGNSVTMRAELAVGLPKVMADRVQLQQVFMNLMLNAIEAMQVDGGELTVKSELVDSQLLLSVSDTGVGLPIEKADQIFSAFFTTKPQGSGMGLAISRSIVESHGGRLWATANEERGTCFYFSLPIEVRESPHLAT